MTTETSCRACGHVIDASAKLCPYCGADPVTASKVDVRPLIETHFPPRPKLNPFERVMGLVRARQGVVVTAVAGAVVLLLFGLHQFASRRNQTAVENVPAVPLTELTDLKRQDQAEQPIPDVPFAFDGNPRTMQTFILEPGAVAPAPPPAQASLVARPAPSPTLPTAIPPRPVGIPLPLPPRH